MANSAGHPLTTGLLRDVSRSFYLSLRFLPKAVREPISLAYLLARAADTIADTATRPAAERLALLQTFHQSLEDAPAADAVYAVAADFAAGVSHAGERLLLQRLPECLAAFHATPPDVVPAMRDVLARIIRGQRLDIERFPGPEQPACLPDTAALDEYTWLVAGCVGEFWTRVCSLRIPAFASRPDAEMIRLGIDYGKGLQLINILRDQPRDMAEGRCYLPASELNAAGIQFTDWSAPHWPAWHAVRQPWLRTARSRLQSGRRYARYLKGWRLRFTTLLPLLIGEATLDLLEAQSPSQMPQPARITRREVKRLMGRALRLALFPRGITPEGGQ